MIRFIDDHRSEYGVEPICNELPIASSTYYLHKARQADASLRSDREVRDEELRTHIQRVWEQNYSVYGVRKVWRTLNREGISVARCTVARLMKQMGLCGAVRGQRPRTTVAADLSDCPQDLVKRDFAAERPNQLWVSDLTYVATWRGFVYVAFVTARRYRSPRFFTTNRRVACVELTTNRPCPRCAGAGYLRARPRPTGRLGSPQ